MRKRTEQRGASGVGLVAAIVLALAGAGLVLYFVLTGGEAPSDRGGGPAEDVPDITAILGDRESGGGVKLQYADRDDPSRLAAELEADEFRPAQVDGRVEPNLYALRGVQARIFLKSGETVLVESESGQVYMPDREAGPESGHLSGNPRITLYPPKEKGEQEVLVAQFDDELRFNFNYARVETPGRLVVTSPQVEFAGNNIMARLNQRQQRIDVLEVERGEYLRYKSRTSESATETVADASAKRNAGEEPAAPSRGSQERDGAEARSADRQAATGAQPATSTAAPDVAMYEAVFSDGVTVTQGERTLSADKLETWIRLIDHKLPDRTRSKPRATTDAGWLEFAAALPVASVQEQTEAPALAGEAAATENISAADGEPVELRWTGPLRVVPLLAGEPEQLANDDVYLRFTAVDAGLVQFGDGVSSGHAAAVNYAATREQLVLLGPGGSVRLASEGQGWMESSRTVVNLRQGRARVTGPGQVYGAEHDPTGPARREKFVRWLHEANFAFEMGDDGRMTGELTEATFDSGVRAVDDRRQAEGDMIVARFGVDANGSRVVEQIEIDAASVTDGVEGMLSAKRLVVPFVMSGGDHHDPASVSASGDVYVAQGGKSLTAQSLSARLVRDGEDALTATDIVAERGVHYVEGQSIAAEADRLEANGLDSIAVLIGSETKPARVDYQDSVVTGERIEMQDHPQRGRVVGAGTFNSQDDAGRMHAEWGEGLAFDRSTGVLDMSGGAHVEQSLAAGEVRTADGEHLIVELRTQGDEMLLDAASIYGEKAEPATVELRRAEGDGGDLAQMLNIASAELWAVDGGTGLIAPQAGRMVMLDRRADSDASLEGWDRGHALFTWQESMFVDRTQGAAYLRGDAQVIHRALASGRTAELAGDVIVAHFAEVEGEQTQVTMIESTGAAYARMDDKDVIADRLEYDTERQLIFAVGSDAEPVRYFDATSGSVISARTLTWDLAKDRIEVDRPSPFLAPVQSVP